jgi:hypothetical protein
LADVPEAQWVVDATQINNEAQSDLRAGLLGSVDDEIAG